MSCGSIRDTASLLMRNFNKNMHHIRLFLSCSWPAIGGYPTLPQWLFVDPVRLGSESVHLSDLSDRRPEIRSDSGIETPWPQQAERLKLADLLLVPLFCPERLIERVHQELDLAVHCRTPVLAVRREPEDGFVPIGTDRADTVCDWGRDTILTALGTLWRGSRG